VRTLRVTWLFLKVGVLNELQYRVNFFVSLLQSLVQVMTGLVVLALVYSHTTELNGWTQPELLCLLGIQILLGGVIRTFIQPNMMQLMEDVQQGTLDYALTKPEDAQVLVSVAVPDLASRRHRVRAILLAVASRSRPASVSPTSRSSLLWCSGRDLRFWLIVTTGAFWIVRMEHQSCSTACTSPAASRSASIRPGCVSASFLVPIGFAITVPASRASRLDWQTMLIAIVFAVVLAHPRWFWRFGLKNYRARQRDRQRPDVALRPRRPLVAEFNLDSPEIIGSGRSSGPARTRRGVRRRTAAHPVPPRRARRGRLGHLRGHARAVS
jgi:ABC-2 type transport system permease protein